VKKSLVWTLVILALCGFLNWLRTAPPRFRGDVVESVHWMHWETKFEGTEITFGCYQMNSLFHSAESNNEMAGVIACS